MKIMALVVLLILVCLLTGPRCATGETVRFSCNFGASLPMNETFCSMVQVLDDDFDWKLTSTSRKVDTGPSEDHTNNAGGTGRFLWADSDDGSPGERASISTPPFNLTSGKGWLTFWYHLFGDGRLEISVCQGGDPVLTLEGDQRNEWREQNMTVSCGDNEIQITFASNVNSRRSDVGVDDVYLYDILPTTTVITEASVTTRVSAKTDELTPEPFDDFTTLAVSTTATGVSLTSVSPLPRKGSNPALPISLSVVAVFFIAALIMVVCFIQKRRQHTEKPKAQASVYKYDNHAYNTGAEEVGGSTTDSRGNTNSTFSSSTWRSDVSTMNGTGTNGTLGESQLPNRSSHTSSGSGSRVPGDGAEPASRHYFVLNPERASMLVENGQGQEVTNGYDPVALYDNKPERYTYIDNEDSSIAMATGAGEEGRDASGYDPVTIKDDITGGYQFIDDTGTPVTDGTTNKPDLQSPYEPVAVGDKPSKSKKAKASERKAPIPAVRKNIPPQPKEKMIDNVLYKPMNGEQMVDNVLYKPIQEDK